MAGDDDIWQSGIERVKQVHLRHLLKCQLKKLDLNELFSLKIHRIAASARAYKTIL